MSSRAGSSSRQDSISKKQSSLETETTNDASYTQNSPADFSSVDFDSNYDDSELNTYQLTWKDKLYSIFRDLKPNQLIWLIKLGLDEWIILIIGIAALLVTVASNLVIPAIIGSMIDSALKEATGEKLRGLVIIVLFFVIIGTIFTFIRAFAFNCAAEKVVAKLRRRLFNKIIEQDIPFFDERRPGDLISRLSSDTKTLENTVTVNISMALRNILQVVGCLCILFSISWKLSLVMLASVPTFIMIAVCHGQFVKKLAKKYQDALADASNIAEESISNIRTVRSFARETKQQEIYSDYIGISYRSARFLAAARGTFAASGLLLGNLALVIVIWLGGTLVLNNELTIGELTSFLVYTVYIAVSVGMLSTLFYDLIKAIGATKHIYELFHRKPIISSVSKPGDVYVNPPFIQGNIKFSHVYFSYPSRNELVVISDLNLNIAAGSKIALVGESGAGKTTIGALLQRFYDVDSGEITIDDYNISSMQPEFLHQNIAVVHQESVLFDCSIRDNILFGNPFATDAEIEEAAKKANAYDFIMEFPMKFDTIVGTRGQKCSGGQKQRIAIARAIISKAKIIIMDESTSNLDSRNEKIVQDALDNLMKEHERTTILIAHRLSSVANADCIHVMKKGKIIESGTHQELLEQDGYYHKLVEAQLLK